MNIEILNDYIGLFKREIIESGFKRDLDDYAGSLPAAESNILTLRDIAEKILSSLQRIYKSDLPVNLKSLFPTKKIKPFTDHPHFDHFQELIADKKIPQPEFYAKLTNYITQLKNTIQTNVDGISQIEAFLTPYLSKETERIAKTGNAIIAVIFNDVPTITRLPTFIKSLQAWERTLNFYHNLMRSDSPEDVQILDIESGSIDGIFNINLDVAINLAECLEVGWKFFIAYLAYKKLLSPISETFHGSELLLTKQKEMEEAIFKNIPNGISDCIKKQHNRAKENNSEIQSEGVDIKIEQITKNITSHIVKGNDFKLLAFPSQPELSENEDSYTKKANALQQQSFEARSKLREIPADAKQKLLEAYGTIHE